MNTCKAMIIGLLIGTAMTFSQPPEDGTIPGGMAGMSHFGPPAVMQNTMENPPQMMMNLSELQNLMNEINIDKTVSAKIIIIARTFVKSLNERILKIQKEELNIKEELLKDKPDLQAIQNAIGRKTQVLGDIEFAQIKRDLEIKSLLTADEYDRWKSAMMKKMKQVMPKFMNRLRPDQTEKHPGPEVKNK